MKYSIVAFMFTFVLKAIQASSERHTVHACKDGRVRLNCRIGNIQIEGVHLADSTCQGSSCCPRSTDCRGSPSPSYVNEVHNSCNGRKSCDVRVELRDIGCGWFAPRNDYANITYTCKAETTAAPTTQYVSTQAPPIETPTTQAPPIQASPTEAPPTQAPPTFEFSSLDDGSVEINRSSTHGDSINKYTTYSEVKSGHSKDAQTQKFSQQTKTEKDDGESLAQVGQKNDVGSYLDRGMIMTIVIVIGVVLTAAIISAAVVIALKKRRVPSTTNEQYDMPTIVPCSAAEENNRNSNFYDFIPDFRDSGNCSVAEEPTKENDYLKPITDREDAPYTWIP